MADLLDDMARASYGVHAAADTDLNVAWEDLPPERKELFRRSVRAALGAALAALPDGAERPDARAPDPEADHLRAAFEDAIRVAAPPPEPTKPRRKVGPEDEERGQQAGDLPFNQRND